MDDAEFLAELDKFGSQPVSPVTPVAVPRVEQPRDAMYERAWADAPAFDDESEGASLPAPESSARPIALAVGGLLLMMCLGAAAAAFVFHDRIALILR